MRRRHWSNVVLVEGFPARQVGQPGALSGRGHLTGQYHHACRLALTQVTAARLAGDGRPAEDAEYVVAKLERLAHQLSVLAEDAQHLLAAAGQRGAQLQRAADRVVTGLAPGHVEHVVQAGAAPGVVDQVGELPDGQLAAQRVVPGPAPAQRRRAETAVAQQLFRPHQAQIGEQDRSRFTEALGRAAQPLGAVPVGEARVDGRAAAAQRGPVHNVVLQQGEGVHQFGAGRGAQRRVAFLRAAQPAKVGEGGPDELPASHELGEQPGHEVRSGHAVHVLRAAVPDERREHAGHPVLDPDQPLVQLTISGAITRDASRGAARLTGPEGRPGREGRKGCEGTRRRGLAGTLAQKLTHLHACGLRSRGQRTGR